MRFLCWFKQCDWRYFGNVSAPAPKNCFAGLYQCVRCKSLSLGSPTDPAYRETRPASMEGFQVSEPEA